MTPAPIVVVASVTALLDRARATRVEHAGRRGPALYWAAHALSLLAIIAALLTLSGGDVEDASTVSAIEWVLGHSGNVLEAYEWLLVDTPRWVQAAIGGALLVALASVTLASLTYQFGARVRWVVVLAVALWASVYAALPFHLSDAGFDDLYVLGKVLGPLPTLERSTKPVFTVWDFAYRFAAAVSPRASLGAPFSANGVLYLAYTGQLVLVLVISTGTLARERLGYCSAITLLGLVCVLPGGALLLSHTVFYELGGAVTAMAAFSAIELARRHVLDAQRSGSSTTEAPQRPAGAVVLATIGAVGLIQRLSFGINGYILLPVLVHAGWALVQVEHRSRTAASGLAAVASSIVASWVGFADTTGAALHHHNLHTRAPLVVGIALVTGCVLTLVVWRAIRQPGHTDASVMRTILAGYLATLLPFFWFSNQFSHPWVFATWGSESWYFAANHARNSAALYPFFAAGLASLVLSAPRLAPLARTSMLTCAALVWSSAYAVRFYGGEGSSPCDAGPVYQRNRRPVDALAEALDGEDSFLYLPLGRDHGDHFVTHAVRPGSASRSACGDPPPASGETLVVSRWSLCARSLETGRTVTTPALAGTAGARTLTDKSWEVALIPAEDIDGAELAAWCAWEADYRARR